ncbi:MAG: DUF5652 family protein [Planctomycetota bacterium]
MAEIMALGMTLIILLAALIVWASIWKGIALWKCGRNNQLAWYVVLLILNTCGILEIVYLAWFQKTKDSGAKDVIPGTSPTE